jgi:hypothetical protein
MGDAMSLFLSGALAAGYAVIALFFARFWRDTHDRLFGMFAAAFVLLAVQRTALSLTSHNVVLEPAFYALRLLAFLVIIAAVVDKNRDARSGT